MSDKNIKITIANKKATLQGTPVIVCGNSDYTVTFAFDDEWSLTGLKTARFVYIVDGVKKYTDVAFSGDTVAVPVLADVLFVTVGVYEGDLATTTPARILCTPSILCGTGAAQGLTEDVYNQLLEVVNELAEKGAFGATEAQARQIKQNAEDIHQLDVDKAEQTDVAVLAARMDTFTQLKAGSTTGDAELADIRVGADGTEYETAGEAVRGQIGQISSEVDGLQNNSESFVSGEKSFNLIDLSKITKGKYANYENGYLWDAADFSVTGYIPYTNLQRPRCSNINNQLALYDIDKKFVQGFIGSDEFEEAYKNGEILDTVAYVRLTTQTSKMSSAMFYTGDTTHIYRDNKPIIVKDNLKGDIIHDISEGKISTYGSIYLAKGSVPEDVETDESTNTLRVTNSGKGAAIFDYFLLNALPEVKSEDVIDLYCVFSTNIVNYIQCGTAEQLNCVTELNKYDLGNERYLYHAKLKVDPSKSFAWYLQLLPTKPALDYAQYLTLENTFITSQAINTSVFSLLKEMKIKYTTLEVGEGKEYTSLREALAKCTSPSKNNRYIINFYGNGAVYDVMNDITEEDLANASFIGLRVPAYTKIVGIGGKEKNIISLTLDESLPYATKERVSTLNIDSCTELEGLTIIGKNTRYAVHDDYFSVSNAERTIKNIHVISDGTMLHCAWGSGYRSGVKWLFENCIFEVKETTTAKRGALESHNNVNFAKAANLTFDNCRFININGSYGAAFGTLFNNANNIINNIVFKGCKVGNVHLNEASGYGSGILVKVSGYANDIKNENVTITNTDNNDYSGYIDLI